MERVAIITGGSRGIGYSFAKAMLGAGYRVAITGARNHAALDAAVAELGAAYGVARIIGIMANAADAEDAARTVEETLAAFGQLDILVNNAGRGLREISDDFHKDALRFWEAEPEDWEEIIRSNVNGPFLMAREAAPHMIKGGWGRIIGVSTSRVTMIRDGFAPYGPSKAALDTMAGIFAKDLAGTGVTSNILLPGGATDTEFIPDEGREGHYLKLLPVDVMDAALLWMVSDAANDVTGARFVGKLWDPENPHAAREDTGAPPLIL